VNVVPTISLSLLVLKTRDPLRVRAFYGALGIEFVEERHAQGPVHFAGRVGDMILEVYPLAAGISAADTTTRLGFTVDDIETVLGEIRVLDPSLAGGDRALDGKRAIVVRDPDGRAVELDQG
jgi:catechol 2,3-dioxygenase-like lactoylglutathione lyase family enzyme